MSVRQFVAAKGLSGIRKGKLAKNFISGMAKGANSIPVFARPLNFQTSSIKIAIIGQKSGSTTNNKEKKGIYVISVSI